MKQRVILIHCLDPKELPTLWLKGQVLHHVCTHMRNPDWLSISTDSTIFHSFHWDFMLLGKIKLVGGNKTAERIIFWFYFFFYFSMTIAWGCNHITGTGGGEGYPQHWAINESPGISTCITENTQGLLDWLKTFFYFPMTKTWGRDHFSLGKVGGGGNPALGS